MSLSKRDQAVIWHPFTQAKIEGPPLAVVRTKGTLIFTEDGREIIDAVSSWWVNLHGHSHPHIAARIAEQASTLEHVIFAGFTHAPAVELAERLLKHLPNDHSRIFFSDNGSTAVETALKMAMQYLAQTGQDKKKKVIALHGSYHGDTFGSMSTNAALSFYAPFAPYLFKVERVNPPQSSSDISEFESLVSSGDVGIFIYEPLIQGVAGMQTYDAQGLERMLSLCRKYEVVTIADEVFTGFGRTGKFLASDHISEKPDLICLSKGLTGGFLPLGVTSATSKIFDAFYADDRTKMFFHGHSYTANPLCCTAALASLDLLEKTETWKAIEKITASQKEFAAVLSSHPLVKNCNAFGTILRFEVQGKEEKGYLNSLRDFLYKQFIERNVLLRPLGNVVYIVPPYCITEHELSSVYAAIQSVLDLLPKMDQQK